jgi:alpha-galactosidase
MTQTCFNAEYHDKSLSRVQAYRKGLQGIRDAVGDDAFLLGGTALIYPNIGLVNSCRISTDVTPYWGLAGHTPESPSIFNVCRNIINRTYQNQNFWINDPDCLIVREKHMREKYKDIPSLTLEETKMLAASMIMSGGSLFLGDRLQNLPEERLKIIQKVLDVSGSQNAFPIDRMKREIPKIWFRKSKGNDIAPHILALFNWDNFPEEISVSLDDLGLPGQKEYEISDFWDEQKIVSSNCNNTFSTKLKAHTCKLIIIHRK